MENQYELDSIEKNCGATIALISIQLAKFYEYVVIAKFRAGVQHW